jgi:hypothetical protein
MGGILGKSIARRRLVSPWNLGTPFLALAETHERTVVIGELRTAITGASIGPLANMNKKREKIPPTRMSPCSTALCSRC